MAEPITWSFVVFVISTFIALAVALLAWQRRNSPGSITMTLLMLAVAWWSGMAACEVLAADLAHKIFWSQLEYFGIATVPVLWFVFALQYADARRWLTRPYWLWLSIIPALTILAALTNDRYHALWTQVTWGTTYFADYDHGPWFWVHAGYSYLLTLGGAALMLWTILRSSRAYRWQRATLLGGLFIPLVVNMLYILDRSPIPQLDLTPLGFAVGGLLLAWNILEFHLLDLGPRARSLLFDSVGDAVLVLDPQDKIVDINPAAQQLLGLSTLPIGLPFATVFLAWQEQLAPFSGVTDARFDLALQLPDQLLHHFDVRVSPLHDRRSQIKGRIIVARDVTERFEAEQRMRQLQQAVEQSPTSVVITDAAGSMVYVNPKFERLTGYTVAEALGQNPRILKTGHTPAEEYAQLWQAITAGQEWQGEFLNRKKNGDLYWEEARIAPVFDGSGKITHYVAVKEDITERKRIEADLRHHADRLLLLTQISMNINRSPNFEQVLNSAMEGLWRVLNLDQVSIGLLDQERQNLRLWAHHTDPSNATPIGLVIPVEPDSSLQYLLDTKAPLAIEDAQHDPLLAHIHNLMVQQHVQSILLVPLLVNGVVVGSIGCDILHAPRHFTAEEIDLAQTVANLLAIRIEQTRLLEDERRLRQQTQRWAAELQGVIDASRDGILMVSMESQLSVINAPALRLLNLAGELTAWHGTSLQELLPALRHAAPPAARVAVAELRRLSQGDERPNEGDMEILARSIHWQNLPVRAGDRLLGWLLVLRDFTEERALAQMRDDMMRTMVHDLRSPLSSILGSLEMLLDETSGPLEPDQTQTINIARRSTERMLELVNAILDVSRLESGHMPLIPTPLRLTDLVRDAFQAQQVLAQSKQIQLDNELPPDLPLVRADLNLIQRVLQNLIGNAIKFTPRAGRVTVKAVIVANGLAHLSVVDTGSGIPPEIRAQLFQKFVTGRQKERGSGLGLAFCKLAIEAHGQRLWVDNLPGSGAVFTFSLPVAD